ncbi:hypothetical protein HanIR_Chr05g0220431 [Helianthus annuus]|nr:hypothetical protein HanIR_Chr05g0220431 [Helianthus annuus]
MDSESRQRRIRRKTNRNAHRKVMIAMMKSLRSLTPVADLLVDPVVDPVL